MTVNAHTKIGQIIHADKAALEAIISISPLFKKLRNPFFRRIMAARTTVLMASRVGGCTVEDFYTRLIPLGFTIDRHDEVKVEKKDIPAFLTKMKKEDITELDVRGIIASGSDPLSLIMTEVNKINAGNTLKIINTFEPTPLIQLLQKKGYEIYADHIHHNLVETYFHRPAKVKGGIVPEQPGNEKTLTDISGTIHKLDVRQMEMPQPMIAILNALSDLPESDALFVYHKKVPVFLLPELNERGFSYNIKEIGINEVHLLIFRS